MTNLSTQIRALLATNMLSNATREQVIGLVDAIKLPISSLTTETRELLPSLQGGASYDTLSDDIIIHIPAFTKSGKSGFTDEQVAAHSITIKLPAYDVDTVRYFSLAIAGLQKQPDWTTSLGANLNNACKLTELVDTIIPALQGTKALTANSTIKSYKTLCEEMHLQNLYSLAAEWTNHSANSSKYGTAITAIVSIDKANMFEEHLQATKDVNAYIYETATTRYTVKALEIVEKRQVVSVSYRFRQVQIQGV